MMGRSLKISRCQWVGVPGDVDVLDFGVQSRVETRRFDESIPVSIRPGLEQDHAVAHFPNVACQW